MNYVNISDICDIQIGKTPKRLESKYWGKGNTWISIADMKQKYIGESKEEINDLAIKECNMKVIPRNTVIMSFKLSIGKVAITKKELYTNEAIAAFIIKDNNELLTEFLYYYLKSYNFDHLIDRAAKGKTLNKRKLQQINVPLIDLEKQVKIIKVLNKVENILQYRQQQIEALSELKTSIFLDMFGDPNLSENKYKKQKIEDIFNVQTGKTPSRKNKIYWENGKIPWIKTTEVNNQKIKSSLEYITEIAKEKNNLKLFPENTILIAMYGQGKTRGQSALLTFPATCNQACAALLPNESVNMIFIWHQLLLKYESLRALGRGGNQPNLNLTLVREFEIINPPIELQNKFAQKIERIDKNIDLLTKSLELMDDLYNSLLHKSFSGEVFREENIEV